MKQEINISPVGYLFSLSVLLIFLILPTHLNADVITLRNGKKINGLVSYQDMHMMIIRTEHRVHKIMKKKILRIRYGESPYEKVLKVKEENRRIKKLRRELAKKETGSADVKSRAEAERKARREIERKKRRQLAAALKREQKRKEELRKVREEEARRKRIKVYERKIEKLKAVRKQNREVKTRLVRRREAARQAEETENQRMVTFQAALWRGLAFPGWGQIYRGQKVKGSVMVAGGALVLYNYYSTRQALKVAQATSATDIAVPAFALLNRNLALNSAYNTIRTDEKAAATSSNLNGLYLLVAYWVYNVIDLYFFSGEKSSKPAGIEAKNGLYFYTGPLVKESGTGNTPDSKFVSDMGLGLGFRFQF